ncbi:hypothetical protein BABINDRAFT_160448 [Babjeviella inositovora NRRL Y-12698]|uniref:Telomere replication protein EST3 n=1 Tax=Babjeviella inositovora NRRL Y-12698 TaxID=984486 RepID=A0A1E3QTL8_9ASCO|nr:uncharacterized protein BABINDRAFT_160448 [Babjeviella inositovora NRRL Y-12698]ODQ81028.1 hypothetical protein BABINDRAFT_160448 [Babjeviella inositovora NRRL Y-12698]
MPVVFNLKARRTALLSTLLSSWIHTRLEDYIEHNPDCGRQTLFIASGESKVIKILRIYPLIIHLKPSRDAVNGTLHVPVFIADATHTMYAIIPQSAIDEYEMQYQHRITLGLRHKVILVSKARILWFSLDEMARLFGYKAPDRRSPRRLPVMTIQKLEKFDWDNGSIIEGILKDVYAEI